jgi:GNAT superfamily N-acetyltransferase
VNTDHDHALPAAGLLVRIATPEDAISIAQLHAESWRRTYRGVMSDAYLAEEVVADRESLWTERLSSPSATQHVWVAEQNAKLCGFACAYTNADLKWGALLDNLHVSLTMHRRGIGRRLLSEVAAWVDRVESSGRWHLWVVQSNAAAISFYEAQGGQVVEQDLWDPPGGGPAIPQLRMAWDSKKQGN